MALTPDDVRHIAKLARLSLTDGEIERFTKDLGGIFALIERLGEVDTTDVEPTAQVTGLANVARVDEVRQGGVAPDALLATSPLPIREHQIETPSAHGSH
jgi:aspartyl-tRNA(Asn)/glutamyl-tRNA(Gln) amidotransferase subunit C